MTEPLTNDTALYYINNILYSNPPPPSNYSDYFYTPTAKYQFIPKNITAPKKIEEKKFSAKNKFVVTSRKDPRKINKKTHSHGHDHGHGHKEHEEHDDHDDHDDDHDDDDDDDHGHGHSHGHKHGHGHGHGHKGGHGGHGHKGGCGHKYIKYKGGGDDKGKWYPIMIGLITAKAIILPLVLKMLAFWSAKGLLLGLIATIMASILSLKKMIEPHYKIEGKKDDITKIEVVPVPYHDKTYHHKHFDISGEGAESQIHPYTAYY